MDPIVIIGSGLAGYSLAREFRRLDKTSPVTLITAEQGEAYSKPMLSNALAQQKSPEQLVTATHVQQATQLGIDVRASTTVDMIDVAAKSIVTSSGSLRYRKLVLALGAQQRRLVCDGDAASEVITVNNLDDYRLFRRRLGAGAKRVAIVGGGLIGCEFANDLRLGGYEAEVIARGVEPLDTLVPPQVGAALRAALNAIGVRWHGATTVKTIARSGDRYLVGLDNDEKMTADIVLSAIGLAPNVDLARRAGLKTNRGIVVDRMLQTSANDIYAIGDCAEVAGTLLLYVMPLMNQARALAKTLFGDPTPVVYPVMPVSVKTPCFPVVAVPPPPDVAGSWQYDSSAGGIKARFTDVNGHLVGFALGGDATSEKTVLSKLLPPPTSPGGH